MYQTTRNLDIRTEDAQGRDQLVEREPDSVTDWRKTLLVRKTLYNGDEIVQKWSHEYNF